MACCTWSLTLWFGWDLRSSSVQKGCQFRRQVWSKSRHHRSNAGRRCSTSTSRGKTRMGVGLELVNQGSDGWVRLWGYCGQRCSWTRLGHDESSKQIICRGAFSGTLLVLIEHGRDDLCHGPWVWLRCGYCCSLVWRGLRSQSAVRFRMKPTCKSKRQKTIGLLIMGSLIHEQSAQDGRGIVLSRIGCGKRYSRMTL